MVAVPLTLYISSTLSTSLSSVFSNSLKADWICCEFGGGIGDFIAGVFIVVEQLLLADGGGGGETMYRSEKVGEESSVVFDETMGGGDNNFIGAANSPRPLLSLLEDFWATQPSST